MTDRIQNHFHKIIVAGARARELIRKNKANGHQPKHKEIIDAMAEVEQGKITYADVKGIK
jgi:DNA-directed RNA polymerase omega subunit